MEEIRECRDCHVQMRMLKRAELWFNGDRPGTLSIFREDPIDVEIYVCPKCRKLEFFQAECAAADRTDFSLETRQCPNCGAWHHVMLDRCPFCRYEYEKDGSTVPEQTSEPQEQGQDMCKAKRKRRPPWEIK